MDTNATPRQVADSYFKAEESRDIERILAHYHPNAVFCPNGERLVGHSEIRTFYVNQRAAYPGLEVHVVREISAGSAAAFEWTAVLIDHDGRRHPLKGANMVWIEDGKYREVNAFFNAGDLAT